MFHWIMIAAIAIGAVGGASIAVAENALQPAPAVVEFSVHRATEGAPCLDTPFRVYFQGDGSELDAGAHSVIDAVAARVAGCGRLDIEIGADRADVEAAPRRAAERAAAVVRAMRAHGLTGDLSVVSRHSDDSAPATGPAFIEATVKAAEATLVSQNPASVL